MQLQMGIPASAEAEVSYSLVGRADGHPTADIPRRHTTQSQLPLRKLRRARRPEHKTAHVPVKTRPDAGQCGVVIVPQPPRHPRSPNLPRLARQVHR
eukprot:2452188-Prymnesium_polylepis.1